ncbi:MAG: c-type cytochrome [Planctomycetes bacterium]|nr:c-type cytochrome [Planctomycetota bacterium]
MTVPVSMKRILTSCGALALLFLPACGGDTPQKPAPKAPAPAGGTSDATDAASKQPASKPAPKKPMPPVRVDMVMVKGLFGNDPAQPPVENPSTPEKVALGRMLYHDKKLSKNGDISCASCHDLATYGQDNKQTSPGTGGQPGERNTPTVWNAYRQFAQFWDYRAATVEDQAMGPMTNAIEHGIDGEDALVAKIKEEPELVAAFAKAFPGEDPVTAENFGLAIGAFERALKTTGRWDKFVEGDSRALTNEEKAGLNTFIQVGCTTCHMTRLVGGGMQQKLGVYEPYKNAEDIGRAKVTGNEAEKYFFKVPSLLNVEKTAPYNHDGGTATLEEVVKEMGQLQLNKKLSDDEVASIITFLKALTAELPADIVAGK